MTNVKFALRDFQGQPLRYFSVDHEVRDAVTASPVPAPSHHIAILDVSGSMWSDLDAVKNIVEKVFTAQEFNSPETRVSLLTYSSAGDCRIHFERVTVADVLAPNSPHLAQIRNLRTRGLTGISQALVQAEKLIDDADVTAISLHTDGYANDPSPYAEAQGILKAVAALEKHPNVFCNTVGYRSACDYALLDAIANRLSGKSIRASNARDVYETLHGTQTLLSGKMAPTIEASIGDFDFITFVGDGKILGGTSSLTVRGVSENSVSDIFRYKEVTQAEFEASAASEWPENQRALLAYSRVNIALGNLNLAKYAMISTRIQNLIQPHATALVASDVALWAADVERFLLTPTTCQWQTTYGLGDTGTNVLKILSTLADHASSIRVDVPKMLAQGYQRRSIKRVAGTRDDQGNVVPPAYQLQTDGDDPYVSISGIDISRDTATINMRVVESGTLIETASGKAVSEVAGIKLDLKSYRNYTLVGDGRVTVPMLPLRISDKRCFQDLKDLGIVDGEFDHKKVYEIDLRNRPLVDYGQQFKSMQSDLFERLAKLTVLQKILSALTSDKSESFTAEQIAELKQYHLTPALYFSPPTTTPYADLGAAQAAGEVDSYNTYKVSLGTPEITNLIKLPSGNAYLQRRFTLTLADGTEVEKPTLKDWWTDGAIWGIKKLSARTKLTPVDDLMYPIYEGFLGLGDKSTLEKVLTLATAPQTEFLAALKGGRDADETLKVFKATLADVNTAVDITFQWDLAPLVFYVGASGLLPESFGSAMTADQLVAKYPTVNLAKAEKEGTFYEVPSTNMLLSVNTEVAHFSTERGLEAATNLS